MPEQEHHQYSIVEIAILLTSLVIILAMYYVKLLDILTGEMFVRNIVITATLAAYYLGLHAAFRELAEWLTTSPAQRMKVGRDTKGIIAYVTLAVILVTIYIIIAWSAGTWYSVELVSTLGIVAVIGAVGSGLAEIAFQQGIGKDFSRN